MAIEIIQKGELPEAKRWRATCSKCKTIFEFTQGDAKHSADQRDPGSFVTCPLPRCGTDAWNHSWTAAPAKAAMKLGDLAALRPRPPYFPPGARGIGIDANPLPYGSFGPERE